MIEIPYLIVLALCSVSFLFGLWAGSENTGGYDSGRQKGRAEILEEWKDCLVERYVKVDE